MFVTLMSNFMFILVVRYIEASNEKATVVLLQLGVSCGINARLGCLALTTSRTDPVLKESSGRD